MIANVFKPFRCDGLSLLPEKDFPISSTLLSPLLLLPRRCFRLWMIALLLCPRYAMTRRHTIVYVSTTIGTIVTDVIPARVAFMGGVTTSASVTIRLHIPDEHKSWMRGFRGKPGNGRSTDDIPKRKTLMRIRDILTRGTVTVLMYLRGYSRP